MIHKYLIALLFVLMMACQQTTEKNSNVVINSDGSHSTSGMPMDTNDLKIISDSLRFDQTAIKLLLPLADSTGGRLYFSIDAHEIAATIAKIVKNHAVDSADIVFLIDKTGSMSDDIDSVKKSLIVIVNEIRKFKNIYVSVSTYGDRWSEPSEWFDLMALTPDDTQLKTTIDKTQVTGGGDTEESVYDGIFEVLNRIKWRSSTKRMILVVGDAPPLTGKLTKHSQKEVIKRCKTLDVKANLYPVIVNFANGAIDTTTRGF
jgi:von Willebrand factor type A domain